MKILELDKSNLVFVNDHVVVAEPKEGVTIDASFVKHAYDIIEKNLPGDYTLILDRKNKYRLMRFEVANEDTQRDRLKGIATVVYDSTSMQMAKIDKPVSKKTFEIFDHLNDAIAWAKAQHA